jgi:hypothetical protein
MVGTSALCITMLCYGELCLCNPALQDVSNKRETEWRCLYSQ